MIVISTDVYCPADMSKRFEQLISTLESSILGGRNDQERGLGQAPPRVPGGKFNDASLC